MVDHDDPVGQRVGLLEILRGQQRGDAETLELADQVPNALPATRIQPGGGLVQEHHLRTDHQTTGDIDASAHTARVGLHPPIGCICQIELRDQLPGAGAGRRLAQSEQPTEHHQVFAPGEHVVDRHLLAGEHDRPAHTGRFGHDVIARDLRAAAVRPAQGRQDVHQRGLARPVRSEQAEHLTSTDVKADLL